MDNKKRSIFVVMAWVAVLGLAVATIYSYAGGGIVGLLFRPVETPPERILLIQEYFQSWGMLAPLIYVVVVMIEVVIAPIPGLMLYAPGGIIFGGFLGGLLSLLGNVLGAGIACQLMRSLGRSRLDWMWDSQRFRAFDSRLSEAGVWVVLALRINPLTSSDLVSYAAGLSSVPTWKVMLGTLLGMAPLCWAQAYLADELLSSFPKLVYLLIPVCVIYTVVVVLAIRKVLVNTEPSGPDE